MSDFSLWRLKKWLTAHEVACLACDIDPMMSVTEEYDMPDGTMTINLAPTGWSVIHDAIIEGFTEADTCLEQKKESDEIFNNENIKKPIEKALGASDYEKYKIKYEAVKDWFEKNGFRPAFFFPDLPLVRNHQGARHQTKLMQIIDRVTERYYGENFDREDRDTYPRQEDVINWLMETFSLSGRQAEAIEIVTAPRGDNYLESKI